MRVAAKEVEVVIFKGVREKAKGLIGMKPIPPKTFFVFPNTAPGSVFHSRGVLEPFDIAFFDKSGRVLGLKRVVPEGGIAVAPAGTTTAVEAKTGSFKKFRGMAGLAEEELIEVPGGFLFPLTVAAVGIGIGALGFRSYRSMSGAIALGAGSSLAAVGITFLIRELFFTPPKKA